jgi:mono/diheme cytochrome c family protein
MKIRRMHASRFWLLAAATAAALGGCSESSPPPFRLDMLQMVSNGISPSHQQDIADTLGAMFGTPDEPFVLPETGLDLRKLKMAAGPVWSDQEGGKHGLYRRHCVHCHGISGDGRGPTAILLNPYPRDYRNGVFKFKSTYNADRPTEEDLHRTLHEGIPGTAMPSFALLPPDEVDALVEYVKYLSIRGQMETALIGYVFDELDPDQKLDPAHDDDQRETVMEMLDEIVKGWKEAPDEVVIPSESALPSRERTAQEIAASAAKGRELFYGTRANCVQCHGPTGLGDGQQTDYDNWSKAAVQFINGTTSLMATVQNLKQKLPDLSGDELESSKQELNEDQKELVVRQEVEDSLFPPRNAIPRNLREGMYRGGRRPLDLFRRVNQGIPGTPMPASGPASPGATGTLTEQEMWQIVDYLRSLPFEPASRPPTMPLNTERVVN